jgi:hypothetical protein
MKSLFKSVVFVSTAILSAVGCQNESIVPEGTQQVHFALHANAPETKTGIMYESGSYVPYWNKGDELGVIFTLPTAKGNLTPAATFKNTQETGSLAVFEGDVTLDDGEDVTFYSFYPASSAAKYYVNDNVVTIGLDVPSSQTPAYDATLGYSFDPKADILMAKPATCTVASGTAGNDVDMYFARLSGVLRVELNAEGAAKCYGEVVKTFKIETSAGNIAGRIAVNPLTGEYSKTNDKTGSTAITATYDTSNGPVSIGKTGLNNVFLSVAPVTIAKGSTITVTIETVTAEGAEGHTLSKSFTTTSDIVFESSKPTVLNLTLTDDNIYSELSTDPANGETLTWKADEFGADNAKTVKVALNYAAIGYTVSDAGDDWTVTDDGKGTLTVYPNAANTSSTDNKELDVTVTHKDNTALTSTIHLVQAFSGAAEPKVLIIDASQLTDYTGKNSTTADVTKTYSGVDIVFSKGAKQQAVGDGAANIFSANPAILIGQSGAYIYNKTAIPGKITKFEIYANKGASAKVSVGVYFSTEAITAYSAEGTNVYTQTLSTVDKVYDCLSSLPDGAKYFWYQVTAVR